VATVPETGLTVPESARPFPFGWDDSGFCGVTITLTAYRKRRAQFPFSSRDLLDHEQLLS
jgi:hypothetical protein